MKNVFSYGRVSTVEQAMKGFSLRDQKYKLGYFTEKHSYNVVMHYEDDCSGKSFKRPQFERMLEDLVKNKTVTIVLVVKWDRFGRHLEDSLVMITKLRKMGVEVIAIEQPLDDDVPENLLMMTLTGINTKNLKLPLKHFFNIKHPYLNQSNIDMALDLFKKLDDIDENLLHNKFKFLRDNPLKRFKSFTFLLRPTK